MKKIAPFLLSSICTYVYANDSFLGYTNCSALDLDHAQVSLSLKDIPKDIYIAHSTIPFTVYL